MNLQRIAAVVAISGAVLGGASIVALGAAAYAANRPQPVSNAELFAGAGSAVTRSEQASAIAGLAEVEPGVPEQLPLRATEQPKPGTGTMAASYNPYLDPSDPEYVTPEERSEWLGQQEVIRACMEAKGFEFGFWQWWLEDDAKPLGLDAETSLMWDQALLGPDLYNPGGGCGDEGAAAAGAARAAGTPLSAPVPPDPGPDAPTPREKSLAYDALVRECMNDAGFDYFYAEWWNPEFFAADPMTENPWDQEPDDMTPEQQAAWDRALGGDPGTGVAYRWEDAGCWGYATHMSGKDNMH